ncbi:hypothetical protein BGX24_006834 [Mortierella sp. AD032]|nr:hypothetical protein BGX24_006834 [Mortierella sp. AD032]
MFVNSSSVAESLPQLNEPSVIIPAKSRAEEEEEEQQEETLAPTPIIVEEAKVEPEAEVEKVTVEPEAEVEKVTLVERTIEAETPAAPSPPESFVLQATVNLEEDLSNDDDDVSEVDELESSIQETKPTATTKAALEVVTDAAATATTATVSVNTTATDYSQVPSPPLTPSTMTSSKRDLITEKITSMVTETESEKHQ